MKDFATLGMSEQDKVNNVPLPLHGPQHATAITPVLLFIKTIIMFQAMIPRIAGRKCGIPALIVLLALGSSCKKDQLATIGQKKAIAHVSTEKDYLSQLKTYKASKHELMAGYFRTWRDKATSTGNATTMKDLPDSLDIADVFPDYTPPGNPFWDSLRLSYIPYLHARGTKVVTAGTGLGSFDSKYANNASGYAAYAKDLADTITYYNMDGVDFDIEHIPTGAELTKLKGIFTAVSKYFGPKSGTGKLLIYDTNQDANSDFFRAIAPLIDYVFLQAYGRSTSNLTTNLNAYTQYIRADQFLPGFSFYEERGANWGDVTYPDNGSSRAYQYAKWKAGVKGGMFSYAIDRDIPRKTDDIITPDYAVTKKLIGTMNPPKP